MGLRVALLLVLANMTQSLHAQSGTEPAPTEAPFPPIRDLMLAVESNQRRFEAARRDYIYHVHTVEEDYDSHEHVKKTTVTDAESLSINGVRVDKVVAKNGHPLTPDEQKKEDERVDKEVSKGQARRTKNEDKGRETDQRGNEITPVSRILELGSFTNPRRVQLDGRTAILLDFAGDPQAKTHNSFEGIVKDLVGQIWIDEKDRVLVRGEGHFLHDFKLGGGLVADIHQGLHFNFRSTKVNDEVWLPAHIEGEGSARVLLFVQIRGHVTVTTSDYRKFRTSSTIIPSNRVIGADGEPLPKQPEPDQPGQEKPASSPPPTTPPPL
jgi:hypothetical protein